MKTTNRSEHVSWHSSGLKLDTPLLVVLLHPQLFRIIVLLCNCKLALHQVHHASGTNLFYIVPSLSPSLPLSLPHPYSLSPSSPLLHGVARPSSRGAGKTISPKTSQTKGTSESRRFLHVVLLLGDEDGTVVDALEDEYRGRSERIVCKILAEWIKGRGRPETWRTLTVTPRECDLNSLAEHIDNIHS